MTPTSKTLLERVRDPSDREAWERFFGLYAPLLEGYARAHGLAAADVEELRDQCLEVIARKMPTFRYEAERGGFQGWLHRIARGRIVDLLRRPRASRAATGELDALADPVPAADELWEHHWRSEHLRYALADARRKESAGTYHAFELLAFEELSVAEVAERTGLNANQVYKAKARVLRRVRDALQRLGMEDEPSAS